ncbi:hypothetical protein [Sphingomonas sp.]|uniref:hypothetical protein n=1 Tax=Sphingomonas sp. TaxID=28214 RepID=UPI00258AFACE|nr:hypothetical protein [Sphingomonas sp.]
MRIPFITLAIAASGFAATFASAQTAMPPASPPPPPGGAMMRADANHDGVVTRDEALAEAGARFDAMDANHDGSLSAAERQAFRASMRAHWRGQMTGNAAPPPAPPAPPAPPQPAAGGNDDGPAVARADYVARAGMRFDRMDANHDGKLDATEMAQARPFGRRGMRGGDAPPPPPPADAQ